MRKPNRPGIAVLLLLIGALGLSAVPATAKTKRIKPLTGDYGKQFGDGQRAYVDTKNGKILSADLKLAFKSGGEICSPWGVAALPPKYQVFIPVTLKHAVTPKANNSFTVPLNKTTTEMTKATGTITGRFITARKATFTVKVSEGSCKAKLVVKVAKYLKAGPFAH
ncbi:MAG: hypothetical protein J0H98_03555 [Solirubrobacterales bacterium]|nr:hypothetical protein [Solirubrobacterales bacterium]